MLVELCVIGGLFKPVHFTTLYLYFSCCGMLGCVNDLQIETALTCNWATARCAVAHFHVKILPHMVALPSETQQSTHRLAQPKKQKNKKKGDARTHRMTWELA
jgi:hypothetical protein